MDKKLIQRLMRQDDITRLEVLWRQLQDAKEVIAISDVINVDDSELRSKTKDYEFLVRDINRLTLQLIH